MNRYPDNEWQEILGNCDVQVALGCTDELTATQISNRTGEITIGVSSTAKVLSSWQVSNYTTQYRETSSVGKRKLMTMDEVLRMPLDKELVIIRGQKVLMLDKFDYTQHPDAKKLMPYRATDYVPQWAVEEHWYERQRKYNDRVSDDIQHADTDIASPEPAAPAKPNPVKSAAGKSRGRKARGYREVDSDDPHPQETLY